MEESLLDARPRVLIVDGSRAVRAALIKHVRGRFQFREAPDGEAGWEIVVLDPAIQVVITEITMPRLDGYGLLGRIRASRVARIQTLPVIMLSGTDDDTERERAVERGATDLIAKGIGASALISRLAIMMRLSETQRQLDESHERLSHSAMVDPKTHLASPQLFAIDAERMLAYAARHGADLSIICLRIDQAQTNPQLAPLLLQPIASLLRQAVRKEDSVSHVQGLEFMISAQAITHESAIAFATRLCAAIAQARVTQGGQVVSITASLGVASLLSEAAPTVEGLCAIAARRAERAHVLGGQRVLGVEHDRESAVATAGPEIDVATALALLATDHGEAVRPHLKKLAAQLAPLLEMIRRDEH